MSDGTSNKLVAYSRAGDVFHYRWAARRCLRLIYPNFSINKIYIEGSPEIEKAGEYVIDVAEYSLNFNENKKVDYYQLKHTTVQQNEPFTLSDLKDTFVGFAQRYIQHKKELNVELSNISFTIITNRKIADSFKGNLSAIINNRPVDKTFQSTIIKYTGLSNDDLVSFCRMFHLEDSEGNYNVQKQELRTELSQLVAGSIDNTQIENLIALVQEKVLPDSDGVINREEVLKRFGITSEKELYPAPTMWEKHKNIVERKQYNILKKNISNSSHSCIIHAAGGIGKSVFCQQLINSLPEGSLGIAYDCFGAGSYRNRSETRHTHKDALVQIINELASKGLCDPLLPTGNPSEKDIMRKFLLQLETSIKSLKKTANSAQLFILIDAADNAEMAAKEYAQSCFAHELLREQLPDDCRLVLLCRTERIALLQPQSFILQFELEPFSEEETLENLRKCFPEASEKDGAEFHRLTAMNPRVQANALNVKYDSVNKLLASLGPAGTSVEKQIELQLNSAISKIKDRLPPEHQNHTDSICLGLASLPPHIPLDVLSAVANVSIEHIKSFVSDIGHSLWLTDTSIQFRDEPTETWFRNTFLATKQNYEGYIAVLEPLAHQLSYIAEVLPQLYLQAGQYNKLINIALSDDYLPENPADARNIRLYRLQFAFKAALKQNIYGDAVKLAMRAGEEVAGNQRQLALFRYNIDLLTTILQSKEKVQEIAFKRLLRSGWDGSENIYSASLLSGIKDYHGEARGYLRAATNWLYINFEEQKKRKDQDNYNDDNRIQDQDILELAFAHLNINGVDSCASFLFSLKPKEAIFRIVQDLARRLIDHGRFEEINAFLHCCIRKPYYLVAIVSRLIQVGKFPETAELETCLDLLCTKKSRIEKPSDFFDNRITSAIISYLEACVYRGLPQQKVLKVLRHYVPIKANRMVYSLHQSDERAIYLKALAIRAVLLNESEVDIAVISPPEFIKKKNLESDKEFKEFKEVIDGMFPWYLLRAQILYTKDLKLSAVNTINESSQKARTNRYRDYDSLPNEIARICASILIFQQDATLEEANQFYQRYLSNDNTFTLQDKLNTLRAAYRLPHLENIRQQLELSLYESIKSLRSDGPDEIADRYISLARAVFLTSHDDASVYFDEAIGIVSKFGDEIVQRWEAVASLAQKACDKKTVSDDLAYRFIRCAELVGENVQREKYWNRSKAMRICTRMSPAIGISALSRWRDRGVGRFEYIFEEVLTELVSSKVIPTAIGWSLTRFFSYHQLCEFLETCLENESIIKIRQKIFEDAIYLLRIEGTKKEYWQKLGKIANKFNLHSKKLSSVVNFHGIAENNIVYNTEHPNESSAKKWDNIFEGVIISTTEGLASLVERLRYTEKKNNLRWEMRGLLKEIVSRLEERSLWDFIDIIFLSDDLDRYDVQYILTQLPIEWKNRVSYKAKFPDIVRRFGERYAHDLTSDYSFKSFVEDLHLDTVLVEKLKLGVLRGLASGNEFSDVNIFFGFVKMVSPSIENREAIDLVDYSLSRFELHIEENFGDGIWRDELRVDNDIDKNIAGFLWSALGAPQSEIRWNAAHCVRKLADFNCINILSALIKWLRYDKVDAFGHHQFPFYNLHARQYLLIAFARISLDNPELLYQYHDLFLNYATFQQHVLIQKFATEITLNIESAFPETYEKESLANIQKSNIAILEKEYRYSTESYWHKHGEVDTTLKFHFGWDFDRYWYEPLGRVFGLPSKQIQELAANLIIKEWGMNEDNGYYKDPRVILWNSSSNERETWHDHGRYPRTDNLNFYLSYHAMLVVAARVIEKMPIVRTSNWTEDNPWTYWLSRHALTRGDGKWLSDCRDAVPLNRQAWIYEEQQDDTWVNDITDEDFLGCLQIEENGELWIMVEGGWHEKKGPRTEKFSISSALVATKTSDALLRALATCNDPYDYKLPSSNEVDMEINSGIFQLTGWINERSTSKSLDEFDPYADEIDYPPYSVGSTIVERFKLCADKDDKIWHYANGYESALITEIWSSYRNQKDETPDQSGIRLKASLTFLKHLCSTLESDLILDIGIKRDIDHRYSSQEQEYTKPKHKIFILSADGKLRTTGQNHKLG